MDEAQKDKIAILSEESNYHGWFYSEKHAFVR